MLRSVALALRIALLGVPVRRLLVLLGRIGVGLRGLVVSLLGIALLLLMRGIGLLGVALLLLVLVLLGRVSLLGRVMTWKKGDKSSLFQEENMKQERKIRAHRDVPDPAERG